MDGERQPSKECQPKSDDGSVKVTLQVLQQAAVLHELCDDVDGLLLRAHRVQLDQPREVTVTIVSITVFTMLMTKRIMSVT